jgi:single-strand DNA-binding protein
MYQQVILVGNLGNDPELKSTPDNVPYCHFRLAVNRRWQAASGEKKEKTLWFRVTAWRKQAEIATQFLTRGKPVMVVGEIEEVRPYLDRKGEAAVALEVTAQVIKLLPAEGVPARGEHRESQPEEVVYETLWGSGVDIPF